MNTRSAFLQKVYLSIMAAGALPLAVFAQSETPIDPNPGAGPYSLPLSDPNNTYDAPIPGFVGTHGEGKANINDGAGYVANPNNYVNPLFFGWADSWVEYTPTDYDFMYDYEPDFVNPNNALGPVTGDVFDVVSLGDLLQEEIDAWVVDNEAEPGPGTLTIAFSRPIYDLSGADFTVFENGFVSNYTTPNGTVRGEFWAELAYVEVSSNGIDFVRFPTDALTPEQVGPYGTLDVTLVHNLAGKHANAYGYSWGTPFDLADVGLDSISYIRIVDIPGSGDFTDSSGDPIHDGWYTWGSGGADIEAFGAISQRMSYYEWPQLAYIADLTQRDPEDDPDGDGLSNLQEYAFATVPWLNQPSEHPWNIQTEANGDLVFSFIRDERLADLTYEIQVTSDLDTGWVTIARSVGGLPFSGVDAHTPDLSEASASHIASVGVLRKVRLRESLPPSTKRFYRVVVIQAP